MSANDKDLTLTIGTPSGSVTADFKKTATVSDLIAAAIKERHCRAARMRSSWSSLTAFAPTVQP